jgi:hypothetical protein
MVSDFVFAFWIDTPFFLFIHFSWSSCNGCTYWGLTRSTTLNMKLSCFTALYISLLTRNSISWGTIIHYLKFFSMRFILSWLQRGVLKPVCQLWPCCSWFMHMTQATVKGADHNLRGLQQSKGTDGSNLQFTYESVICFSRCCAVTT